MLKLNNRKILEDAVRQYFAPLVYVSRIIKDNITKVMTAASNYVEKLLGQGKN